MFQGSKKLLKYLKYLKRENHNFHEKLPMFSLKLKLFDFTSLRQGQFLANDGEKAEKADFKKHRARTHRGYFFTTVQNSYSVPCWEQAPNPKKQKQRQKWHSLRSCLLKSKSTR